MTTLSTVSYQNLVQTHDNEVFTTSKIIADSFGKLHKNVLRKIEQLSSETPYSWYELNFTPIQVEVDLGQNRTRLDKAFEITKDGFMLLVMGFTGKKAMALKIEFINAFNWMYDQIHTTTSKQRETLISACDKLAVGNMSRPQAYAMVANHFGYEKPIDIPATLLPEAVAFAYEVMLARRGNPNFNLEYLHKMFGMGTASTDSINQAVRVAEKHMKTLESSLESLATSIDVIKTHNANNFSVFESLRWQVPSIENK